MSSSSSDTSSVKSGAEKKRSRRSESSSDVKVCGEKKLGDTGSKSSEQSDDDDSVETANGKKNAGTKCVESDSDFEDRHTGREKASHAEFRCWGNAARLPPGGRGAGREADAKAAHPPR